MTVVVVLVLPIRRDALRPVDQRGQVLPVGRMAPCDGFCGVEDALCDIAGVSEVRDGLVAASEVLSHRPGRALRMHFDYLAGEGDAIGPLRCGQLLGGVAAG